MNQAVFVGGLRTPFARAFKGAYHALRADDLLVRHLESQRTAHPALWDVGPEDLVLGCAYPEHEQGYNLGRVAALGAGLNVPGMTVNRLCASSLEAVAIAAGRVQSGWGKCYLTAGVESMSRVPRRGANFSESARVKSAAPFAYIPNGETAERVARQYPQLDRDQQEAFAAASHERADDAYQRGRYANQLDTTEIDRDELIRVPVNREKMASLPPAFEEGGSVTAATSSPLTDGATSGWVVDASLARELGIRSGLEILDAQVAHVAPELMGLGPVPATRRVLQRHGLSVTDIDAWEINEAFAIQVLASMAELGIPAERVNGWGGALALGHPLGASGLRLVMTLHDRLAQEGKPGNLGIATLCVGGGQGMALLVRYIEF